MNQEKQVYAVFTLHTLNADSFPYPVEPFQQTLIVNTVIEATSARDERGEKTQPYNSEENIFFPPANISGLV